MSEAEKIRKLKKQVAKLKAALELFTTDGDWRTYLDDDIALILQVEEALYG